jgi:hypothetical protein
LELTFWPSRKRLWSKVHAGRHAEWIDDVLPQIKAKIESKCARAT